MTIWALHGFLGQPSDFDSVKKICLNENPDLRWNSVDYMHLRELSPTAVALKDWGDHFNRWVETQSALENVIVGYSQGGRLALHAIKQNPNLWKSAVLISTNPGISEGEKPLRLRNDQEWAQKFLNENFEKTVQKWNQQAVFQGSQKEPERLENQYNRRQLADCLVEWSVAKQENFESFLGNPTVPILYVSGKSDSKYEAIGKKLSAQNRKIQHGSVMQSGHRVIFDQPGDLAQRILEFIEE